MMAADETPAAGLPAPKKGVLADLFAGQGNISWELGRVLMGVAMLYVAVGIGWNIHLRQPIDLGPGGLSGGIAGIFGGGAAFVAVKTWLIERTRQRAAAGEPADAE